jgi:hypothetical protein
MKKECKSAEFNIQKNLEGKINEENEKIKSLINQKMEEINSNFKQITSLF